MAEIEPSPLDYNATVDRMEPGIAPVDLTVSMASIAISLKRIADLIEMDNPSKDQFYRDIGWKLDSIAGAVDRHSTKVVNIR